MSNGMEIQLADVRKHELVLSKQQEQLDKWCSSGEVRSDALIRYALAEMAVNEDLRSCTPTSIYLALLSCGVTGLVPGKLRGYSFLVPFRNTKKDGNNEIQVQEATFMMGWKGVKHIGYRAGLHMVSEVIREQDNFAYDKGTTKFVRYSPALRGRGPIIGAAAWVELPRGGLEVEFLDMETLEKIRGAATRIRKSPAWDGPFKDQMQRKSALKRLGKQIEMGEEFLRADAIEIAQDEHGTAAPALDELTDGAATKFLSSQSTEAAAFGHLPRPAQSQVPVLGAVPAKARAGRIADAPTRPTSDQRSNAGVSASGTGVEEQKTANGSARPSGSTTGGSPDPTPSGAAGQAASTATPAASSQPSSATANPSTTSQASGQLTVSGPSAGDQSPSQSGDVALEPSADEAFDTTFFADEDPQDRPRDRADWVAAFKTWSESHQTKDDAVRDWKAFQELFSGWLLACASKDHLDEHKGVYTGWSSKMFTRGRKADPAKKIAAIAADPQIIEMGDAFARRHKELP